MPAVLLRGSRLALTLTLAVGGVALCSTTAANAQTTVLTLPVVNGAINAFAISGSTLYIGGDFSTVGGVARDKVAAINLATNTLTNFNPHFGNSVTTASVSALKFTSTGALWVGGNFDSAEGLIANGYIANRDIAQFNTTGTGTLTGVTVANDGGIGGGAGIKGLALDGSDNLYAVGDFSSFGNGSTGNSSGIAAVTSSGATISTFQPSTGGNVSSNYRSISVSQDGSKVYFSNNGSITYGVQGGGTTSLNGLAQLNASSGLATGYDFQPLDGPFGAQVFTTLVVGNSIYIGGGFNQIGGAARGHVAKFNNANGTPTLDATFGASSAEVTSGGVRGITLIGSDIYMNGDFNTYDGTAAAGVVAASATTGVRDNSFTVTTGSSSDFYGSTLRIAGFGGGGGAPASVFSTATATATAAGTDGVQHATPYYAGFSGIPGGAAAPEPGVLALIGSLLPGGLLIARRRRA